MQSDTIYGFIASIYIMIVKCLICLLLLERICVSDAWTLIKTNYPTRLHHVGQFDFPKPWSHETYTGTYTRSQIHIVSCHLRALFTSLASWCRLPITVVMTAQVSSANKRPRHGMTLNNVHAEWPCMVKLNHEKYRLIWSWFSPNSTSRAECCLKLPGLMWSVIVCWRIFIKVSY
jgi:hypothetical protein